MLPVLRVVAGSNSVRLTGVTLAGNDRFGLYIRSRGNVWLRSGTIIAENAGSGVYVEDGSLRVDGAQIINNRGNGVEAMIATVKVERTATIAGNWNHGIIAGGYQVRQHSIRLGVNIVMYALTLDYKKDMVHLPIILERLRRYHSQ